MMADSDSHGAPTSRFLSTLLRNLPGMAYRFVNDGYWTTEYASEGALALTGWRPEELVGNRELTIFRIAHPEDVEAGYAQVTRALAARRPHQLSYRIVTRDGRTKWVFEQGQGVFDDRGEVEAVEGFISDITPQMVAQIALEESERKYRSIFQEAVFGIFQSSPEGRFINLNPAAARVVGYEDPEQALRAIQDIATDVYVDPDERRRILEAIVRDGHIASWRSRVRRRDGTIAWVDERSRGVFDDDGNLRYIEGTIQDISAEIAARDALIESEWRASELRTRLADAHLRALRLQLQPHFLFNALNTVAMMIRTDETAKAQQMLGLLGEMFRHVLKFEGEQTVPLVRELAFCESYLRVQQYRFEDRLRIGVESDDGVAEARVPTHILLPVAENAVKHGVARVSGPCRVDIRAGRDDGFVVIEMVNERVSGSGESAGEGHGIGVANTRARLQELYGKRAAFRLVPDGGRMRAILRIPVQEDGA